MAGRFDAFIETLSTSRVSSRACNQYARNAVRQSNLRLYLEEMERIGPTTLLVGEAPSYRGGRLTGIAFVSETVILDGVSIAAAPGRILGSDHGYRKATRGAERSTEASATMVWATIRELLPLPLLWNAFPFHPFHAGEPDSNRCPDKGELEIGRQFITELLRLFPIEQVVAVGNQAALSLTLLEIEHVKVRHPSQGGKTKFVEGMARLSQMTSTEDSMPRKSQIQEIKEGRSMRERVYTNRNQPAGPKAPLPTKNAVNLSTVPSSAKEKFNGGKDE